MSKELIKRLKNDLEKDVVELGYELVDIEFVREGNDNFLRFYIYKEDGITVDDCELVSKRLSDRLDELDPISQSYYLEVSSPDLNRPLKTDDDLRRNLGVLLDISLYKKIDDKKQFRGELLAYDDSEITIESEGQERKIDRKDISKINVAIVF